MKHMKLMVLAGLLTLTGCATLDILGSRGNPEGYDGSTADNYDTPRTEENPVKTFRVREYDSTEYHTIEARFLRRTLVFFTVEGDLVTYPESQVHPEDRP